MASYVENRGEQFRLWIREHACFERFNFVFEDLQLRKVVIDHPVQYLVQQEVHTAAEHIGVAANKLLGGLDASGMNRVECDEVVRSEKNVQFVRAEVIRGSIVANPVHDDEKIVAVVVK